MVTVVVAQQTESMPWVGLPDGSTQCTRHGVNFRKPRTCKQCKLDKPPAIDTLEKRTLPRPPKGCSTSAQHELWFTRLADKSFADAERLGKQAHALANPAADAQVLELNDETGLLEAKAAAPTFDFHLERQMAAHRDVAIKARRVATQLAIAREDEDLVTSRERRLRDQARKERTH